MKVERLKGAEWRMSGLTDLAPVSDIPGLRTHGDSAVGMIDAVAAAAKVLGARLPVTLQAATLFTNSSLRLYQEEGVARLHTILRANGGALLADDVGLGKSRQAIYLANALKGRTLIICPAYVRQTWRDELAVLGHTNVATLQPRVTKKDEAEWERSTTAPFVITSYELVDKVVEYAFRTEAPTVLIMDEAHYLCGRKTKRSNALEDVARLATYRLALTATPLYSRPRDFYKLLRVLFGARFGSPSTFDFRYCAGKINQWGGMDNKGSSNLDELRLRLSYYMVRREKRDVLTELPPLSRQVMWVEPTEAATRAFRSAMQEKHSEKAVVNALIATLDEKVPVAVELAAQAKQFLLFTYLKRHAHEMHRALNARDVPCVLITGDMPADKRSEAAAYAASQHQGVVATIDSAGAGINALRDVCGYGIFHSVPWVPNQAIQAEGRLHRMGQTLPVQWVYVAMRESMDEVVVTTCVNKLDAARAAMPEMEESRAMRDAFDDSSAVKDALTSIYAEMT